MLVQTERTVITFANAITLVTELVNKVSGTEVADTINGSVISRTVMSDMVASEFNKRFATYTNQSVGAR